MAPLKARDLKTMAPPITTSSKTTTRTVNSKIRTTSLSRMAVQMLIRVFRQQATLVATTIMAAAHLLPMEANTW
jgi:hypothetical protein